MKGGIILRVLVRLLLLISIILIIVFYSLTYEEDDILVSESPSSSQSDQSIDEQKKNNEKVLEKPKKGLATLIGKNTTYVTKKFGHPDRIDPTENGYDWWIYNNDLNKYFQVGIHDKKVVTVYAIGEKTNISPFKIGQPVSDIYSLVPIETYISLNYKGSSYRFELTENDLNTSPLIQMGGLYVQLYIDKFDDTLSSVRILDAETLIKLRPYELVYRGKLLEADKIESEEEQELIDRGIEKQIFDITNVMRIRNDLNSLQWDEKTAAVALSHSKDMFESNDFSHSSKKSGELSDRLKDGDVFFQLAGENIAANYVDAPAVMEGWLNSKGHRETLLNKDFTHIGVGVYKKHYTQNFIQKWKN